MNIVEQIHNEFYTAGARLLDEAKRLLNIPIVSEEEKASRLQKLGFGKSKPVEESKKIFAKRATSNGLIKNIEYFSQKYPTYKFITEDEVKRICEKYNLVFGEAANYLGDIPEKNIQDIERFKLSPEDCELPLERRIYGFFGTEFNERDITSDFTMAMRLSLRAGIELQRNNLQNPWLMEAKGKLFDSLYPLSDKAVFGDLYKSDRTKELPKTPETLPPPFRICAPIQDFKTDGYEVREGYKLVYDPVVLQPVKGGYLIITAWGDEAKDEMVADPVKN